MHVRCTMCSELIHVIASGARLAAASGQQVTHFASVLEGVSKGCQCCERLATVLKPFDLDNRYERVPILISETGLKVSIGESTQRWLSAYGSVNPSANPCWYQYSRGDLAPRGEIHTPEQAASQIEWSLQCERRVGDEHWMCHQTLETQPLPSRVLQSPGDIVVRLHKSTPNEVRRYAYLGCC